MFRNDPDVFQLILKNDTDLSPCIICYSMDKAARNFMRDYPSLREWEASARPYHFEIPKDFKLGDMVEMGFEIDGFRRMVVLTYFEKENKKLRFRMEEKKEQDLVETIEGYCWRDAS